MNKNNTIPFFEVNGNRYEIKRNRYLQAEFDEMKRGMELSEDEQVLLAKENEFCSAVMEEKVDNFHVVAVLECIIGIIMACFVMCNIFVAALGFALLAAGTSALARDEEVSAGV